MSSGIDELSEAIRAVEKIIEGNIMLHGKLITINSLPETLQSRILALFRPQSASQIELKPYEKLTPWSHFGIADGAIGTISWRQRDALPGFAQFESALDVELKDPNGSGWFSLEIDAPYWEIRRAHSISFLMMGNFDRAFPLRIELFGWDHANGRHWFGFSELSVQQHERVIQTTFKVSIPHNIALDETREPRIALFFVPEAQLFSVDYIWFKVN